MFSDKSESPPVSGDGPKESIEKKRIVEIMEYNNAFTAHKNKNYRGERNDIFNIISIGRNLPFGKQARIKAENMMCADEIRVHLKNPRYPGSAFKVIL